MPWKRVGDCPPSVCKGECCQWQGVWYPMGDPEIEKFLYLQQVRGSRVLVVGDKYLLENNIPCQYLTAARLCALHPSMKPSPMLPPRPDFCEEWPTEPGQLINMGGHCGYSFVEVDFDGNEIEAEKVS